MYLKDKCTICQYWYVLDKGFTFHPAVCNGRHDVLMMPIYLNSIAILNIPGDDYCSIIAGITNETINLLRNADLVEKKGTL